jgi:vacuolar-type H+-ATPase subunit F/Vma7
LGTRANLVKQHLDFSFSPNEVCLPVRGDAGVGKTRCIFETVNRIDGAHQLCVYTNDETAVLNFAYDISSNAQINVIIVADECLNKTRQHLDEILGGVKNRVRVVAINNTDEPSRQEGPEPIVEKLPNEILAKILDENFPTTPPELRRAAIDLAEGFVRIAADLCKHGIDKGTQELGAYVDFRIPEKTSRQAVEAVSLFERVGWRDDVANQLSSLAKILGIKEQELRDACLAVKDASPGFIVLGGRFFYVTPEAIARVCFPRAWQRWEVRNRFAARSGFRSYSGDIVAQCLREANVANAFMNDPLEAIRYWARVEHEQSLAQANRWKQQIEEERW